MKTRKEVKWFAEQMEKVLRKNDKKGGWKDEDPLNLVRQIQENTHELDRMLWNNPLKKKLKTCVDIANYAMMVADKEKSDV